MMEGQHQHTYASKSQPTVLRKKSGGYTTKKKIPRDAYMELRRQLTLILVSTWKFEAVEPDL